MSEKNISYINRNFSDYKQALIDYTKKYYGDIFLGLDDASVASWLIDINADVADNLSYHIDRVYQETNINSANERASLYAIARSNGVKIPGPKGAMAEVKFTCQIPIDTSNDNQPNWNYAPIIKKGTKVVGGVQVFELLDDVDFSKQYNSDGQSDRTITPLLNSNGVVVQYKIEKLGVVTAGESKIYRMTVYEKDIKPFMEIVLPVKDIMNVESVIVRDGTALQNFPSYGQFYSLDEDVCSGENPKIVRFFEVDSLAQQEIWGTYVDPTTNKAVTEEIVATDVSGNSIATSCVTRGEWKQLKHKFITEYTDKGYLKIIFGAGLEGDGTEQEIASASSFSKYIISKTIRNDSLGYLPRPNSTIFVLYRVGGGKASNLAKGAINSIALLNAEIGGDDSTIASAVRKSLKVVSTSPSVSGKDMPSVEELRNYIKYNTGEQGRCVTVKDYISRILNLPPKYGTPFRVGVSEENNKIVVYLLGIDYEGKLTSTLPVTLINNMQKYLKEYRMINDYVEIKSGKIINLGFNVDVFIDKNYNKSDVITNVINTIYDYMDINKHNMCDDIFVGDLEKEIMKTDGVISLIDLKVYNKFGDGYSETKTTQEIIDDPTDSTADEYQIDLEASESVLISEGDCLFEIKRPERDIIVRCKVR